ncbi:MAG: GDSL-type esterase/lipase family protein, partial [Bacteroidota bacterium]|nr:GDSL-type esterase/lipase family protein [Bacteroidota bacterium]
SQLEGDRITSYIRNKLQSQFGGNGPGLFQIADIVPHMSILRELSPNWDRYSVMDRKKAGLDHLRYGALSSFSRFTPLLPDTVAVDTLESEANIILRKNTKAYRKAQAYTVCRMYFGWHRAPLTLTFSIDGEQLTSETIEPSSELLQREWRFAATPEEIIIGMQGKDSPDVYGISLEGTSGVNVDNVAARGGAGYEFNKVDQQLLKGMLRDLDVELLILQYGGNVLPHMKSVEDAQKYGRAFGAQIARFKRMLPGVSIIVIGPSDMSIKEGEEMVTRPFLEDVRDAMKQNSLAQGAAFWDLYEAMGGRGSMVSWVNATPALAASDFTHFSPQGAKKVGELFYTALINDLAEWMAAKEEMQ